MFKGGWIGKILRINLSNEEIKIENFNEEFALNYIGGRGFAIKILWNEIKRSIDPLSPENKIIFSTGPLTGLPIPSSGKIQIASKSPLTGGYGDGNIGSKAAVQLKKAGYDALILEGKAKEYSIVYIKNDEISIEKTNLWGKDTWQTQDALEEKYGRDSGILLIGPAGENLVKYAVIISEKGRAGGRPGLGAVMGSKRIKAIIIKGDKEIPVANKNDLINLGKEGYKEILSSNKYDFWIRQGTMGVFEWCQVNSTLPTRNFSEGVFEYSENLDGNAMEKYFKVSQKGCPLCNMVCGNLCKINSGKFKGEIVEVDYENIGMLGPNLGIKDMDSVLSLNLIADKLGIDTISLSGVLAFVTEAFEKGFLKEEDLGFKIEWGDIENYLKIIEMIISKERFGKYMAEGTLALAKVIGNNSKDFAMQVKGLEISAYECHTLHGMALAYGTSPIGAHHKDAWFISLEIAEGRDIINKEKVEKLILMQRRRSFFETAVTCRLPWVEVGFNLDWYPKYLEAATGVKFTWDKIYEVCDRIYSLIRAFWIRELGYWNKEMDYPPEKWFKQPYKKGPYAGRKLDKEKYDKMLSWYYEIRGWDERGIPKKSTLKKLGLEYVIPEIEKLGLKLEE